MERDSSPKEGSTGGTSDSDSIVGGSDGVQVTNTKRSGFLTVTIIGAKHLKRQASTLFVKYLTLKVKVEAAAKQSGEIKARFDEDGVMIIDQNFTFDVKDPKNAALSVHVLGKSLLGKKYLGRTKPVDVAELMEEVTGGKDIDAQWHALFSKDGVKRLPGMLLMQIVGETADPEQRIHAFVGTWNVGNARPPKDLSSWLPMSPLYEIVAIGAQECDYPPQHPHLECSKDWMMTLISHLGPRYRVVRGISRGKMRLVIFVRDDAEKAISEIDSGSEATGFGHVMPNKGGLCIAFKFWDTGLCFVNCHFAAHVGRFEVRNSNFREIVGQLHVGLQSMDILNQFHHVFWMGDLNYRLDFGDTDDKLATPKTTFWNSIVRKIEDGDYKSLLQFDELHKGQAEGKVLHGFQEGDINFPPSFKMQQETLSSYDKKRIPAWCDRVLWRSFPGCKGDLLSYTSVQDVSSSDHKPVVAVFVLTTFSLPPSHSSALDDKRWHIHFQSLRAKNLQASDLSGLSDPYISFVGPNLLRQVQSKVRFQTLHPVWNPSKDLPTLVLNTLSLQRLENEYLMLRVLDHDYATMDDIIGYGVIQLAPAVAAFRNGQSRDGETEFVVELSHHGVPAGTLEGIIRLTWEKKEPTKKCTFRKTLGSWVPMYKRMF